MATRSGASDMTALLSKEGAVLIGDGGMTFDLEKRGLIKAGLFVPTAVIDHPEAVEQLHEEYAKAGADVLQACTFYASPQKLKNTGYSVEKINQSAIDVAKRVAQKHNKLLTASISGHSTFDWAEDTLFELEEAGAYSFLEDVESEEKRALARKTILKEMIQNEFKKQLDVFQEEPMISFVICEYFTCLEEMEWAIESCKSAGFDQVAATMSISSEGSVDGHSPGECAQRMLEAGATIIGVNCNQSPTECLEVIRMMKQQAPNDTKWMVQPTGFHIPEKPKDGFTRLPEFPFALEPRLYTRYEVQDFARKAYNMGIQYIGGCCGFSSYHIRAIAEELEMEHGPPEKGEVNAVHMAENLLAHLQSHVRERSEDHYWKTLVPATGRPLSSDRVEP